MRKGLVVVIIILIVGAIAVVLNQDKNYSMFLTSPSFNHNEKIHSKFTCDGGNINPELHIQNVPPDAKSLALIMDDPDAVGGQTFTHWLIWNIDPKTEIIKQESKPTGSIEGQNDADKIGYLGPCPPDSKPHRYFFKLYALGSTIDLQPDATKKELETAIARHLIERAELIGIYER